jgi:proton glutamate symport protein
MFQRISKWMTHPLVILSALVLGIATGLVYPGVARYVDTFGSVYLSLLKMMVLPFIISAITAGISRLLQDHRAGHYLARICIYFPLAMFVVSVVATSVAVYMAPGAHLNQTVLRSLGELVKGSQSHFAADLEVDLSVPYAPPVNTTVEQVVTRFIPDNIFSALSDGDSLKVLVFCIIFGVALGTVPTAKGSTLVQIFDTVNSAATLMMRWLNMLLPFALFTMVTTQVATVGLAPLAAMLDFILTQAVAFAILFALCSAIIWRRSRGAGLFRAVSAMQEAIILAITTRNSITCIPAAIQGMSKNLRFDPVGIELVLPLGVTMCRFGPILYYAVGTVFIAQIYGTDITLSVFGMIAVGCVLAGMASAGTSGALTITMLSLVCGPLGLPVEAAIVLFIAVDPLLDVIRTLMIVYGNCAISALICPAVQSIESVPAQVVGPHPASATQA